MARRDRENGERMTGPHVEGQDRQDPRGASAGGARRQIRPSAGISRADPFIRAENEDDDGYDPYSDRRPDPEPLFERDPWG